MEREWFEFGHKFGERCGHACADVNQRSPIFLQWLDCVHQLIRQFPCDFEFSEAFLVSQLHTCQVFRIPIDVWIIAGYRVSWSCGVMVSI